MTGVLGSEKKKERKEERKKSSQIKQDEINLKSPLPPVSHSPLTPSILSGIQIQNIVVRELFVNQCIVKYSYCLSKGI